MRNTPFLIRVWLPLIGNGQFLIWSALSLMRNGSFLIRVCLPPMRKSRFLIWGKASLFREAGYPANSGNRKPDGFGRRVRRDGIPQLRKSRASNSVKAACRSGRCAAVSAIRRREQDKRTFLCKTHAALFAAHELWRSMFTTLPRRLVDGGSPSVRVHSSGGDAQ